MKLNQSKNVYRVLDANLNRLKEGLRVCEDTARFVLNDKESTAELKKLRHAIGDSVAALGYKKLAAARETLSDVGVADKKSEYSRSEIPDVFVANAQRCKESIRVLEEYSKLLDTPSARRLKRVRYAFYGIEKRILKKI